jgi:predicted transposase YdaD
MGKHHDTGYKELFSHPEFIEQLIEGFAPPEIAAMMDFATLKNHSGHYITPLFEEKLEDVVWSVEVHWRGRRARVFLYVLIEFQSRVDASMALRMLHYVASFYQHLIKSKVTTAAQGLPPILPIVLYNGTERWRAATDIYEQVRPAAPVFLRGYQPHLRYYLIDEGRYTREQLGAIASPLSGIFEVEIASGERASLQAAVDRLVALIQADPNKARLDQVITRWLKRHLQRLGADIDLERMHSFIEDKAMLAENLENWAKREREEGRLEAAEETARNLLKLGVLSDGQIAQATGLTLAQIEALRAADPH